MDFFTESELAVADILRTLPELFNRPRRRITDDLFHWGTKKRRSAALTQRKRDMVQPSSSPPPAAAPEKTKASAASIQKAAVPAKAALSPASPLHFYQSGGEETDNKGGGSSGSLFPRRSAKTMVRNKEWIKEQNRTISSLYEVNKNLQQEATSVRQMYEALCAENALLREMKTKMEMARKRIDQDQQHGFLLCGESSSAFSSPVVGPTTAHSQHETSGPRPQSQPEVLVEPPPLSLHHQKQPQTQDQFHQQQQQPDVTPTQLWNFGDGSGGSRLPDLNASVDESGLAVVDSKQMVVVDRRRRRRQQQQWPLDAKKMATAEARKKRIEINRRKAAAAGGGAGMGLRSAIRVGVAIER